MTQHDDAPAGTGDPAPADTAPPSADDVAELHAEVAELRSQVSELDQRWRRALADFDNLRKRVAGESVRQREEERARVAAQWLPVVDNLELALQHAAADPATIVSGIQAVLDQAVGVLAALGYPRRQEVNQPFDPARHEVVAAVHDPEAAPGTILQVVRPGYGGDDRPLRPAAVVVAKGA
jgi:molecular chaperone GrpE